MYATLLVLFCLTFGARSSGQFISFRNIYVIKTTPLVLEHWAGRLPGSLLMSYDY